MPGSIAAFAVSCRLCRLNFAGAVTWSDKAETEAFQASGGLNASRFQDYVSMEGKGPFLKLPQVATGFID
jgi:hypothetical protein